MDEGVGGGGGGGGGADPCCGDCSARSSGTLILVLNALAAPVQPNKKYHIFNTNTNTNTKSKLKSKSNRKY